MRAFDIERLKDRLLGPTGFEFFLSDPMEEAKEVNGLASSGHAFISQAIACVFVGFLDPAEQLFEKARVWISEAISSRERPDPYFPHGTEAIWHGDLATAEWYLTGEENQSLLGLCVDHHIESFQTGPHTDLVSVGLAAVDFLLASRCKDLDDLAEAEFASQGRSLLVSELGLASNWCDTGRTDDLKGFLDNNTRRWLEKGHYQRPVKWTRLIEGSGCVPSDTIKEVLKHL